MTNKLLGVIAINLTIITGLLAMQAIPTATAQSGIQRIAICDTDGMFCADVSASRRLIVRTN